MRSVVLQPMYLPWMGFFGMMDVADTFVYYDDVQFSKQSWQQRNRIRSTSGDVLWLTVPIKQEHGRRICDTRIDSDSPWRKKHWKSIETSYCKAPFFKSYAPDIEALYGKEWESVADLNIEMTETLRRLVGVRSPRILRSSHMPEITGAKEERLLNLLGLIETDEYVSGPAAKDYIKTNDFADRGIKLYWFEFAHPQYPQHIGEFIPYLSVIDLLFNVGEKSLEFIKEGTSNALRQA